MKKENQENNKNIKKINNIKMIICILILIILVGIISTNIIIYNNNKPFELCTIKTYEGTEITNYNNNKRAFYIEPKDSDIKITVNGEMYEENVGFYKTGRYEIEVTNGEKTEKKNIQIKQINRNKKSEYNIYYTSATLPTLFASMNMVETTEQNSYIWFGRGGTLNTDKITETYKNVTISKTIGDSTNGNSATSIIPEIREYIINILNNDPDAYFHLYIDDLKMWAQYPIFTELGITDDRYNVTMYCDGTISYVANFGIMQDNEYEKFVSEKNTYDQIIEDTLSNKNHEEEVYFASYLQKTENDDTVNMNSEYDSNYILLATLRDNVKYYLQYPEMFEYKDEKVSNEMKKANIVKISANDEFEKISNKELFYNFINLDKKELDSNYFNSDNAKYLIITGTKPFYGSDYNEEEFKNVFKQVYEKYHNEYTILYKPHPSALPTDQQKEYLESFGVKILPGKLPMEAISFTYKGLKLGGFASSLYMSVDEGNTLFFFANDKTDLVSPLDELYDELFNGAEFIKPE